MKSPSEHEKRIIAMVDSFTKTVVRNFSRNLKRTKANAEKHYSGESEEYTYRTSLFCFLHPLHNESKKCTQPEKVGAFHHMGIGGFFEPFLRDGGGRIRSSMISWKR